MAWEKLIRPERRLPVALILWIVFHIWAGGRWIAQNFCSSYTDLWSVLLAAAYLGSVFLLDWMLLRAGIAWVSWMIFAYWTACTGMLAVMLLMQDNPFPLLLVLFTCYTPLGVFGNLLQESRVSAQVAYTVVPLALSVIQVMVCGVSGWRISLYKKALQSIEPSND